MTEPVGSAIDTTIRSLMAEDHAFVLGTLGHIIEAAYPLCGGDVSRVLRRALADELLVSCDWMVACNPDDRRHVVGFVGKLETDDERVLSVAAVYVSSVFRRLGIATALVASVAGCANLVTAALWTPIVSEIDAATGGRIRYRPELLMQFSSFRRARKNARREGRSNGVDDFGQHDKAQKLPAARPEEV